MKKTVVLLVFLLLLSFCACHKTPAEEATGSSVIEATSTEAASTEATEENTEEKMTEKTTEEESSTKDYISSPVLSENIKGCYYGAKTGTSSTYTGLEPLPLTDFAGTVFENERSLPDKTIEHSFGVAKNEEAHEISKANQKFFDDGDYDALAWDNKTEEKAVYLTFDCGYENGYTAKILDVLRDKNVKAAFFCTLPEMRENPEIIARMINEGHIVGNHSVTHPDFSALTRREMYEEVKGFDDYIREHFGYSSLYFRYPQGKYSENSLDMLNSMGFKCIFWSLAYEDWNLNAQKGAEHAVETVIGRIHPGAVMLLHAVSPDNAEALGEIIDTARSMGYEFKLISEADI